MDLTRFFKISHMKGSEEPVDSRLFLVGYHLPVLSSAEKLVITSCLNIGWLFW